MWGVSNMLTNVKKGEGGVKSMLTLAKGIEVRYSKTHIFLNKSCFPGRCSFPNGRNPLFGALLVI